MDERVRAIADAFHGSTRYRIKGPLGEGGMGIVLKAEDLELKRTIALKIIETGHAAQRARFMREARAQAQVEHESICSVYDAGEVGPYCFIAMQYIPGWTLPEAASRMSLEQKIYVMRLIADALHSAHRTGLIHRDIKPRNIMVMESEDGKLHPYLLDFGIQREIGAPSMTSTGVALGTPEYMAPEQILGESDKLDRRTDIYGLGATFYELLGGIPPVRGENRTDVLLKAVNDEPVPLRKLDRAMPVELAAIVMKCLEKEPQHRYESARALSEDLGRYLNGERVLTKGTSWRYRMARSLRRNRVLAVTLAGALALIILTTGVGVKLSYRARQQEILAQQLGRDVEAIAGIMRAAYMLPLHDITREREIVGKRMAEIEARIAASGKSGRAAGSFALGRAYRLLEEYERARSLLQSAWDFGYRDPVVAYELGFVMGHLYQDALKEIEGSTDPAVTERRQKEIQRRYREPAIEYLRLGQTAPGLSAQYVEALIDFYERKYDEALERVREAAIGSPWPYEEVRLEGQIIQSKAVSLGREGDLKGAALMLGEARQRYWAALEMARSHPGLMADICRLFTDRLDILPEARGDDNAYRSAMLAVSASLKVDPESSSMHLLAATVLWRWADHKLNTGEDPAPDLRGAIEAAERARTLDPNGRAIHEALGDIYDVWFLHLRSIGQESIAMVDESIRCYQRALVLEPIETTYMSLGSACSDKMWGALEGSLADPGEAHRLAIESFGKALRLNPSWFVPYYGIAKVHRLLARYEVISGRDPSELLRDALLAAKKSEARGQSSSPYYFNGTVHQVELEYALATGGEADTFYKKGVDSFERALSLEPDWLFAHTQYARLHTLYALAECRQGRDPSRTIGDAIRLLNKALTLNPRYADTYFMLSDAEQVAGEFDLLRGRSPDSVAARAIAMARKGLHLNRMGAFGRITGASAWLLQARADLARKRPVDKALAEARSLLQPDCASPPMNALFWVKLGESHLIEGQALARAGRSPESAFKTALAFLDKALGPNPNNAETHRLIAAVYLRSAEYKRSEGKAEEMQGLARHGLSAAERALSIHPNYADVLALRTSLQQLRQEE